MIGGARCDVPRTLSRKEQGVAVVVTNDPNAPDVLVRATPKPSRKPRLLRLGLR